MKKFFEKGADIKKKLVNENEIDNVVREIINLERNCAKYVTEQSEEEIKVLLNNDNFFIFERDGEIIASAYKKPLLEKTDATDQIYRLGGLSIKDAKAATWQDKKLFLEFIEKLRMYIEKTNPRLIAKTDNPVIARILKQIGAEELNFDECQKKYPDFINAYLTQSSKPEEYYQTKSFYIRDKKLDEQEITGELLIDKSEKI